MARYHIDGVRIVGPGVYWYAPWLSRSKADGVADQLDQAYEAGRLSIAVEHTPDRAHCVHTFAVLIRIRDRYGLEADERDTSAETVEAIVERLHSALERFRKSSDKPTPDTVNDRLAALETAVAELQKRVTALDDPSWGGEIG